MGGPLQCGLRHALAVADRFELGSDEWIVALFHDAVEDGVVTDEVLLEYLPARLVSAIGALTHDAGDSYAEYIERVATDELATRVKLADLETNLARSDEAHASLRSRYETALARLSR